MHPTDGSGNPPPATYDKLTTVTTTVSEAPTAWKHASAHFRSRPDVERFLVKDGRSRCRRSRRVRVRRNPGGHVRDGYSLNNRYLDSSTGVFLSVDPLVSSTGMPYLYGNGNPTTFSDPLGLEAGSWIDDSAEFYVRMVAVRNRAKVNRHHGAYTPAWYEDMWYDGHNMAKMNMGHGNSDPTFAMANVDPNHVGSSTPDGHANSGELSQAVDLYLSARTGNDPYTIWDGLDDMYAAVSLGGAGTRTVMRAVERFGARGIAASSLLDELAATGVKHNPANVLRAAKDGSGRIVFLEKGNARAGLAHIVQRHGNDFARRGVSVGQIPDLVTDAATKGLVVGYQGAGTGRPIYEVVFNGTRQRVAVTVGNNGFIVGANPA